MPRYIDADALMKEFRDFVRDSNNSDFATVPNWNDAVSLVGSAPTADVVEVIRCKECEYWKQEQRGKPWNCKRYYCTRSVNIKTEESDFYSFAKRRNNEEECISWS